MRTAVGILLVALVVGWIAANALASPKVLYNSAAPPVVGVTPPPPTNTDPGPDWLAAGLASGGSLLVLTGARRLVRNGPVIDEQGAIAPP